jgi:hypothetical protein
MKKPVREATRREEYAAATRQAIFDAAHLLFAKRGYFATKVEDIAAKARVAPATVYAVAGGKQGLLQTLIPNARLSIEESIPNLVATVNAQRGKRGLQYLDYLGQTVPW